MPTNDTESLYTVISRLIAENNSLRDALARAAIKGE